MPRLPSVTLSKVPEITVAFWITKVLTTGMGESTSDYLVITLGPAIAIAIGAVVFAAALTLQFRTRQYTAGIYWFAVVMVSVFGTMCADVLHVGLGIPYLFSTIFFAVVLAAIFIIWFLTERTLSIHSITTRRRELFYWATVLATFALGTAAGDFTATTLHLGFLGSGILFAVVIAVPALAWWKLRLNAIVAFWFAYVTTRPLGASFADWMAFPPDRGGLDWGTGPVSVGLSVVILGFVIYLGLSRRIANRRAVLRDAQRPDRNDLRSAELPRQ
ncbi:MAG: hypothetical protein QOH69_1607 [Actinomycetota bacterium]|jgi:uncharacterized membrane-anchored protein|nr:hypothetical protein [Actinomycetota bacterium]